MKYQFKWKRLLFWNKREVVGHKLEDNNVMILFYEDGGLESIPNWDKCSLRLQSDWALAAKKTVENQTGVDLKTSF